MESKENNSKKSILIPVFDICNLPPMDKVVALANKTHMDIHIAGFVSSVTEPGKLMEQTIRLTRILRVMLHRLRGKVKTVTSKIYTTTKKSKVCQLVEDEKIKVIVSQKIDRKLLGNKDLSSIMFLQLTKSRINKNNDTLIIRDGQCNNLEEIKEVMAFFGDHINYIQDQVIESSHKKKDISSLRSRVTVKDIKEIIKKRKTECVAVKKDIIEDKQASIELLNQNEASVLLY